MNTQSDRQHWFVLVDGRRHGPFTYDDLTRAAREGIIGADTHVWRSGWKNWHLARSVKGLVVERPSPAVDRPAPVNERPMNEAPLAPDDTGWTDEHPVRAPAEETFQYAPPQQRSSTVRRSQEAVALRFEQQPSDDRADQIFADEWRMLAEQRPVQSPKTDHSRAMVPARTERNAPAFDLEDDFDERDEIDYRAAPRGAQKSEKAAGANILGAVVRRAAMGVGVLVLAGGGWALLQSGAIQSSKSTPGSRAALVSASDLPATVASLPAVVSLQHNDPAAFERFKKRYLDSAVNARDDEVMTLARNALRKSVKHLLAISPGDVLLEITETSLAYLQGLQANNPESCVWLSDDTKGARLTSNLAKELPVPFIREMSVLDRIASTNPHMAISPMSMAEARPYFEKVAATLQRQAVKTDLQARQTLDPSEFAPYCALVIAFYQAVLDMPRDDKINLLRRLYADAAVNADSDLKR